jgi:hypothetical protein
MDLTEIKAQLYEEALFGRSPQERRAQIRSIVDSLQQSWRKGWVTNAKGCPIFHLEIAPNSRYAVCSHSPPDR